MDWQNVTLSELADSLKEVDLKAPRPVSEFFDKFTPPKNYSKWQSRLKCNVYYYRTNYLVIVCVSFLFFILRNLAALPGMALGVIALLCLNDPFASGLNDRLLRLVRKVHAPTAHRMRSQSGTHTGIGPRKSRGSTKVLGVPRNLFAAGVGAKALLLIYWTGAVFTLCWAYLIGLGVCLAHATLRSPNLKARLASNREEFRAVWRGYQADMVHDYTL